MLQTGQQRVHCLASFGLRSADRQTWTGASHKPQYNRQQGRLSGQQHQRPRRNQEVSRTDCGASPRANVMAAAPDTTTSTSGAAAGGEGTLLCTSITAKTPEAALREISEAYKAGAEIVELRLDYLDEFNPETDLKTLITASPLPVIVTLRPTWEGGQFNGPEAVRLATLKYAALLGAQYVDVEFKSVAPFFAGGGVEVPVSCKVIVSSHNYEATPPLEELQQLAAAMREAGADIVKIATTAQDVCDSMTVLRLLEGQQGPTIAIAMGERGQVTRLLAPKYGGFLTFGALSAGKESAPGQTTLQQLRDVFRLKQQGPATKVYGIVGNPVSHSRSPVLHNAAMGQAGVDGLYVPFLVDDMARFLEAFSSQDFAGFSVTIPHKEDALKGCSSVDPVASQIGAVNTLVRQPDGGLKGYNTDWEAAIGAIEQALGPAAPGSGAKSPLSGRLVVVVGAGGAGRALAFGAAARGAKVIIANRNRERAEQLASLMGVVASVVSMQDLASGSVRADVLANSTSVGMHPAEDETPVPASALPGFGVVFDAVYTPLETRLLREAATAGCKTVGGLAMFVGQAAQQFRLFNDGCEPPVELMEKVVLDSMQQQ